MPLNRPFANLSLETPPSSRPGSARSGPPSALYKQESFDISGTNTFSADDLRIHGVKGMADKPSSIDEGPSVVLSDLAREKPLGRGASGRVVLMKHKQTGDLYALKELDVVADPDARHQASNELRIAHSHACATDHLVNLMDAFFVDGKICILMEFCDGGSLEDAFDTARTGVKGLPLGPIAMQIGYGLRHMHVEMKQVHRDLKPANVLLTASGVVKLSDFGISKQLDFTGALAMTQVGSTAYMSPERLNGDEYGFTSDVWSLGVIVLEALLGSHPFEHEGKAANFMTLYSLISSGTTPPPPEGTPPELADFVEQALHVDPAERPNVDELLHGAWLGPVGKSDTRQPVLAYLMKAAAKRLAGRIAAA